MLLLRRACLLQGTEPSDVPVGEQVLVLGLGLGQQVVLAGALALLAYAQLERFQELRVEAGDPGAGGGA